MTLIEPQPDRRAKALDLGVARTLDPAAGDVAAQARDLTGGDLFDVVIESAGHPAAMAQALTSPATTAGSSTWGSTSAAPSRPNSA